MLWGNSQGARGSVATDEAGKRGRHCVEEAGMTHVLSIKFELHPDMLLIITILGSIWRPHKMPLSLK